MVESYGFTLENEVGYLGGGVDDGVGGRVDGAGGVREREGEERVGRVGFIKSKKKPCQRITLLAT
ncbi:hypothetical protein HanRHA438_Chr14g0651771 [Helianthus annuus]|nr:hypothetical protein HanRHA438_Chr14g0651771 [Helianthus annuus]